MIVKFIFKARWLCLALIIVFIVFVTPFKSEAAWHISQSVDKMTGKKDFFATSDAVLSLNPMSQLYRGTKAWIGIGCTKDKVWAYIGFSSVPNLIDTETKNGYSEIDARVKWNDSLKSLQFTQVWGDKFLHFESPNLTVEKLKKYNSLMVELNWYNNEGTIFKFNLNGFSAAIGKIFKECGIKITKIGFEYKFDAAKTQKVLDYKLLNAVEIEDINKVKTLLSMGADVNARDGNGRTALMWADHTDIAKLLMDNGADVNAKNKDGKTALMRVAASGYPEIAKLLISHGADVNARDGNGRTALMWAEQEGNIDVINLLITHGAKEQ